jgi:BCD family chlorophyll transporter-like MFS transporter
MLSGAWGEALQNPDMPYSAVYHLEIAMLFVTLALIGPITRSLKPQTAQLKNQGFGVAQLPG